MKDKADYSKYECPYSHLEKECGHELHGPEGYQNVYSVWCACGFRAPVFYLEPNELGLKLKKETNVATSSAINRAMLQDDQFPQILADYWDGLPVGIREHIETLTKP